jgi:phosphopantothenate synthetase
MNKTEGQMIDPSDMEIAAMQSCLAPLGEYVGSIDMQRPLADYSRQEVLTLIDVVVSAYQDRMLEEHERMAAKERAFLEQRIATQAAGRQQGRV